MALDSFVWSQHTSGHLRGTNLHTSESCDTGPPQRDDQLKSCFCQAQVSMAHPVPHSTFPRSHTGPCNAPEAA